ncbi:MAG: ferritin family protein [Desulfobacteraceae bacterium]
MDQNKYLAILERAIDSEIEAALFYARVAEMTTSDHLKEMFATFSREERKHRSILEGFLGDPATAIHFEKVADFGISETVAEPTLSADMQPADAIVLAMKKEESAMHQYPQLAEACNDGAQREVFLELAAMEREHKMKMEAAFVDIGYPEVW